MIVVRAPLRVSFIGGGSDLSAFYRRRPGRVLSAAIDKYVYIVINRTPMLRQVSARYSASEQVPHSSLLKHTRIRAALLALGIEQGIELASFASLPARTGLGSSSSFSAALMKGLHALQGRKLDERETAELASQLEIELVGEPIGKQDQYAAAYGGLNVLQFNPDESVDVEPVLIDFKRRMLFEDHLLLFFTGVRRDAATVLEGQRAATSKEDTFKLLSEMADAVPEFRDRLLAQDLRGAGRMLHEAWMKKRRLTEKISTPVIDALYEEGLDAGAWGGKILGAGGGGCLLFVIPPEKKAILGERLQRVAAAQGLAEYQVIPFRFVQAGTEILYNGNHPLHDIVSEQYA